MRLIDADALRNAMYHAAFETDTDMQKWDSGCWIRYKLFENVLDAVPTIETVPKDQIINEMMKKYNEGLEKAISEKIFSLRSYNLGGKEKRNE